MNLFEFLRSDGSIIVNKRLARAVGLESSVFYSEILSKHYYFAERGQIDEEGCFFNTIEDMETDTTLSAYQQRKAIKVLEDCNLLECIVKGMPAKRHFRVNFDEKILLQLLFSDTLEPQANQQLLKNFTTRNEKTSQQEVKKLHLNNTNNNTKDNNTKLKDMVSPSHQNTLIDLKSKVKTPPEKPTKKKKLSHSELAEEKITSAKAGEIDWSQVTDRDFTFYYIRKHNELFRAITFDRFSSVSIIRDNFINKYEIKREDVCDYIDEVLKHYHTHPKKYESLTFSMIQKATPLMNELIRLTESSLSKIERQFNTNTFNNTKTAHSEALSESDEVF